MLWKLGIVYSIVSITFMIKGYHATSETDVCYVYNLICHVPVKSYSHLYHNLMTTSNW